MVHNHYWMFDNQPKKENIENACNEFKTLINKLKHSIFLDRFDDVGLYKPEINTDKIWFNKIDFYTGFSPFKIDFNNLELRKQYICNTENHNTYDRIVCLAILCLANNIPELSFSSDGLFDDWKHHIKSYETNVRPVQLKQGQMLIN